MAAGSSAEASGRALSTLHPSSLSFEWAQHCAHTCCLLSRDGSDGGGGGGGCGGCGCCDGGGGGGGAVSSPGFWLCAQRFSMPDLSFLDVMGASCLERRCCGL